MPKITNLPKVDLDNLTGDELMLVVQGNASKQLSFRDLASRERTTAVTISGSTPTAAELNAIFQPSAPMYILVKSPDARIHRCVYDDGDWYISSFTRIS